jgi:hypothetical protein
VAELSFNWRHAARLPINVGGGQIPTRRRFLRLRGPLWIAANGIHHNPRFYKYYWKIWTWEDCIPDEELPDFKQRFGPYPWLAIVPKLSFSNAIKRMKELCERREKFMVVDERVKRDDPTAPWDIGLIKSKGSHVAPAYDDDPDEPFHGHK